MKDELQTIRVGYEILLEVGIDPATGRVVDVTAYSEEANSVLPVHVYNGEYLWSKDVHAVDTDWRASLEAAEASDPRVKWAHEIAGDIEIGMRFDSVPYTQSSDPEPYPEVDSTPA